MSAWPYPGDAPVGRARRVAHAYRAALLLADPDRCAQLDATMAEWGQTWVVPRVVRFDPDDWLSVVDAADVAVVSPATLRKWRGRGRITGRCVDGRWEYRAADVLVLAAAGRRKPSRNAVTQRA